MDNFLKVSLKLLDGINEDSTCEWNLFSTTDGGKQLLAFCYEVDKFDCTTLPKCKEFNITAVNGDIGYEVDVYTTLGSVSYWGVGKVDRSRIDID